MSWKTRQSLHSLLPPNLMSHNSKQTFNIRIRKKVYIFFRMTKKKSCRGKHTLTELSSLFSCYFYRYCALM